MFIGRLLCLNHCRRNYSALCFEFLIPAIQIILFCLAIGLMSCRFSSTIHASNFFILPKGATPRGLNVAVLNNDRGDYAAALLRDLDHDTISQVRVDSLEDGFRKVRSGDCWGVIFFNASFSTNTIQRFLTGNSDEIVNGSQVQMYMDNSNEQIVVTIEQAVLVAYNAMADGLLNATGKSADLATLPLFIQPPVYGEASPSFTDFVAPGL